MTTLKALRHCAPALLIWLGLTGAAGAQPEAPTASPVVDGSYTVTYAPNCDAYGFPVMSCQFVYLLEMTEPGGEWTLVSGDWGSATFTKPPGTYSYMVWSGVWLSWYDYVDGYSPVTTVTVADAAPSEPPAPGAPPVPGVPAAPARDNILTQLEYSYEVRRGDFNGDNRIDLFIKRIAGGTPFNGTIEELFLRQDPVYLGNFSTVVPTPDQAAVASSWTLAPTIETRLHDIDVDGYVDLTLVNLASVVPGAVDQIVYSPGQVGAAAPGGMKPIDNRIVRFVGDAMDYMADPDYFITNVPIYYFEWWTWYSWCPFSGLGELGSLDFYFGAPFGFCYFDYQYYAGVYADFSVFDGDAVALWSLDEEVEQGRMTEEQAVPEIVRIIEGIIQSQMGGWPMEELLGQTGEHVLEHVRRRIEAAQGVLNASRALPEHVDMDNLPPQTPRARDVIHVTGHRIKYTTKAHLALEYARPQAVDGLYWPTTLSGAAENWPPFPCFPWMDYSLCGWGKLLAETNKTTDHWYLNWTVGYVVPWEGTPGAYWSNTLEPRHNRYIQVPYGLKPDYNALPDAATNTYNSNSYVNGLNGVDGWFVVPLAMNSVYPGWDRPVPDAFFQ